MNPFTIEALTDSVNRYDTWELLGNPTPTFVAERILMCGDTNQWSPDDDMAHVSLEELIDDLTERFELSIASALRRIARAIKAHEVICWDDDNAYLVGVNQYLRFRLKARWSFNTLCGWAEDGTWFANGTIREEGLREAIAAYEDDYASHGREAVAPLADVVGLTYEQAFKLLHSDGWNDSACGPDHPGGFHNSLSMTKRRMAYRVIDYLRLARGERDSLDY